MVLNCQSLAPKIDTVMDILKTKKITICFLNETYFKKAKNATTSHIEEYGFKTFHSNVFGRAKGTAILLKSNLKYNRVELGTDIYSSFDIVVLHLPNSTCLVCLYRWGRFGAAFDFFLNEFASFLTELVTSCDSYIICGDFNIHYNKPYEYYTEKFNDLLDEFDLKCLTPIVPTQKCGNTLDLVITNMLISSDVKDICVENHFLLGDHYPTFFSIDNCTETKDIFCKSTRYVRRIKDLDKDVFREDLQKSVSEASVSLPETFESAVQLYNEDLKHCLDKHAPKTVGRVIYRDRPNWMDHEYVTERAKRRRFERVYKHSRTPINKLFLSLQSKICSDMVKVKKKARLQGEILSRADNQKALFSLIHDMSDCSKTGKLPEVYGCDMDLANDFNKFFNNKINTIRSNFNNSTVHTSNNISTDNDFNDSTCLYNFRPCNTEEISSIIKSSGITVSPADIFPSCLLADNIDILLPRITDLVNLSLSTGSIDGLKEAIIRPLLKEHNLDINELKNYRPVSNLQFLGKLIERVVLSRLQEHMSLINYNNNTQFGYKKSHSTELLLLKFINDVLVGIDSKDGVVVLLIDLSAAFDTVDNRKLLNILCTELNIRGTALKWFKSFLLNRSQCVLIGSCMSESIEISCGVPQGSVLGPVLFNIYINSLSNVFMTNGFNTLSYADDNSGYQVFSLSSTSDMFNESIPNCISRLRSWMDEFFLKINEDKTKIMVFGRPSFHRNFSQTEVVLNNGDVIEITDRIKYLGFYFDNLLSLTTHVNKVTSHCYSLLKTIRKIRRYLTEAQAKLLIHSLISSRIDYCNVLMFGAQKVNCLNKLQRVQDCASKIVLQKGRLQGYPSSYRLEILHWLPVEKRVVFKALVIIFNCFQGTAPVLLSSLLVRKFPDSIVTDDDFNCDFDDRLFYPTYSIGRRAFQFYAPRLWNVLPIDLCSCSNKDVFKKQLKTYLWESFDELKHNFNRFRNM